MGSSILASITQHAKSARGFPQLARSLTPRSQISCTPNKISRDIEIHLILLRINPPAVAEDRDLLLISGTVRAEVYLLSRFLDITESNMLLTQQKNVSDPLGMGLTALSPPKRDSIAISKPHQTAPSDVGAAL